MKKYNLSPNSFSGEVKTFFSRLNLIYKCQSIMIVIKFRWLLLKIPRELIIELGNQVAGSSLSCKRLIWNRAESRGCPFKATLKSFRFANNIEISPALIAQLLIFWCLRPRGAKTIWSCRGKLCRSGKLRCPQKELRSIFSQMEIVQINLTLFDRNCKSCCWIDLN